MIRHKQVNLNQIRVIDRSRSGIIPALLYFNLLIEIQSVYLFDHCSESLSHFQSDHNSNVKHIP